MVSTLHTPVSIDALRKRVGTSKMKPKCATVHNTHINAMDSADQCLYYNPVIWKMIKRIKKLLFLPSAAYSFQFFHHILQTRSKKIFLDYITDINESLIHIVYKAVSSSPESDVSPRTIIPIPPKW
jgi:hypothetical protein